MAAPEIKDPLAQDFGHMMGSDPEYMDLQRKQAISKALMAKILEAQGGSTFRKSPIAAILDFMSLQKAKSGEDQTAKAQTELYQKHEAAQQGELAQLQQALQGGDPRAAIAQALSSRYPQVQKVGQEFLKANGENFRNVMTSMPGRFDPNSAISSAGGGGYAGGLQAAPPPAPPSLISQNDPTGRNRSAWQVMEPDGKIQVHPVTDPSSINIGDKKMGQDVIEQQAKYYSPGGKGYELGQTIQQKLGTTADILRTIQEDPQMGAGANGFQLLRKWTETLGGKPLELSGSTDQMKAQLTKNVIDTLGGLGNQVSDADRKAMSDAIGSLETNPAALRRMMLIAMKYQMSGLNKLESEATQLNKHPLLENQQIPFPGFKFNQELAPQDANDLEQVFKQQLPPLRIPSLSKPGGPPPGVTIRPAR